MQGVYQWLNTTSGKIYIGSAKNVERRKTDHLRSLRNNTHHSPYLQRAWNKYGPDSFQFEIIEIIDDELFLRARETAWLQKTQSYHPDYGYNICRDGWSAAHYVPTNSRKAAWKRNGINKRGIADSPEVRARKKAAAQGRTPPSHKGIKHSEGTRTKMREAWARKKAGGYVLPATFTTVGMTPWNKGKALSEESRLKISQSQKATWTPERRGAQAERLRQQNKQKAKGGGKKPQ